MSDIIVAPSFQNGLPPMKSEAEARAIRARRVQLEASYKAEGFDDSYIAAHVTDAIAEKMLNYERQTMDFITKMFGGRT